MRKKHTKKNWKRWKKKYVSFKLTLWVKTEKSQQNDLNPWNEKIKKK